MEGIIYWNCKCGAIVQAWHEQRTSMCNKCWAWSDKPSKVTKHNDKVSRDFYAQFN